MCLINSLPGEKIVPIQQEAHMSSSTIIAGAVMFGREKMQPGVIVEPYAEHAALPDSDVSVAEFRNKVWYCEMFHAENMHALLQSGR